MKLSTIPAGPSVRRRARTKAGPSPGSGGKRCRTGCSPLHKARSQRDRFDAVDGDLEPAQCPQVVHVEPLGTERPDLAAACRQRHGGGAHRRYEVVQVGLAQSARGPSGRELIVHIEIKGIEHLNDQVKLDKGVRHVYYLGRSTGREQPVGVAKMKKPVAGGKKRPTIEVVAKRAGVSRQTVSNAANAPHRLRPETLQKVLGTIDELGYRPSQAARSLRTSATQVIGCRLLPGNYAGTGGVLDRLLHALCDAARAKGYGVLTFSADNDDDEIGVLDDLLRRKAVDGFVLANTHHGDVRPGWLIDQGARFVAFGRPWGVARSAHSWVDVDGASGTSQAVRHLAELGHSRIGFLGLPQGSGVGDDRFQGWQVRWRPSAYPPRAWSREPKMA